MSRLLFFTSMMRPVTMLSAAIATTIIRISRITLRSTTSASDRPWLLRAPIVDRDVRPQRVAQRHHDRQRSVGIADADLQFVSASPRLNSICACSIGM